MSVDLLNARPLGVSGGSARDTGVGGLFRGFERRFLDISLAGAWIYCLAGWEIDTVH